MSSTRFIKALYGKAVDRPPIWFMRQAGRYLPEYMALQKQEPDFIKRCKNTALAAEITLQPMARFGELDAAIVFSDILTIPEAMPLGLRFEPGIGPIFATPIRSQKDVVEKVSTQNTDALHYVGDVISQVRSELNPSKSLLGFSGSPWTLATYMVEGKLTKSFEHIKGMRYQSPETLHTLLEKLTTCVIDYGLMQMAAGADAFMLFDSWGGMLSFADYPVFSLHYLKTIIKALQAQYPTVPIILYTKGGYPWLDQIAQSGVEGIGIDWCVDLQHARNVVGPNIALQGNLDPTLLLGSRNIIAEHATAWCQQVDRTPGYIFNLGHGMLPPTPPENVGHLIDTVCQYYE